MVRKIAPAPQKKDKSKNFSKFLLFLIFHLWGLGSYAQSQNSPFTFKQFTFDNGTLSNVINCFLKDKDGYLWIGTGDGLRRFDGDEFSVLRHEKRNPTSLIHSEVLSLCEDKYGRIWTGTQEGVGYFVKKTNQFVNVKAVNKTDFVCFNIVCDVNGDVWFSIRDKGIFRYSEKTKHLQNFNHNPFDNSSITSNRIVRKGMVLDPFQRGIWLATTKGVNFFEFSSQKFYHKKNNPNYLPILLADDVEALALDEEKLIYFDVNEHKIKYFDLEKYSITKEITLKSNPKKEEIEIISIVADRQHNLWFSSWSNNAFYYEQSSNKTYDLVSNSSRPTSIAGTAFWDVFQQKDGNIWIGTTNGISITNPQNNFYEMYDFSELYPPLKAQNQLYSFTEDPQDSTWWLAATQSNFLHFYPKTNVLETFSIPKNQKNPLTFIRAIIINKNDIYVATTQSFHLFDKKTKILKNLPLPVGLNKTLLTHVTQKGDSIWFFGENSAAFSYKITSQKWSFYPILVKVKTEISCTEVDNLGNLWIAIHGVGIAKFSNKKQGFELVNSSNYIDYKKVGYTGMQKDKEGDLWFGTYDLIKFNPKKRFFESILDINFIQSLLIAKDGKIWISAFNDYYIFNPKTEELITKTIPIEKKDLQWTNHLYPLLNGQIVSVMRNEVIKIDPTKLIPASTKDKILISKVQLVDNEIMLHKNLSEINLSSNQSVFVVFFSSLKPPGENKYKYNYKLLGHQKDWTLTQNNYITYTNLDGGEYVFKVKGIDNNGYETPVSTLRIHIDTVFYKSKWFLYFCVLSIFGLIYAFVKFRANQKAKIIQLEMQSTRLEKDKTEIQYQNLINHLNPHFLFNSLTSLNSLIMTEPKLASKFLQKLSLIYRYILQNKDKELVSLEQELAFVKNYIDLQKSRFEDGLQIYIEIETEFLHYRIVPVTLQNLFENAIKHNSLEEDKPLIINVFVKNGYLNVSNNLQMKKFVETSNKQGLESLKKLYQYLTKLPLEIIETQDDFIVKIPLL
jgi:ligand-binding sensor domain-containing protein/sensor histidine kinase YesM